MGLRFSGEKLVLGWIKAKYTRDGCVGEHPSTPILAAHRTLLPITPWECVLWPITNETRKQLHGY